jgi:uroporphyrinogen-III decarboxylase
MDFDRDYEKHNDEVKRVWDSYNAKKPIRMPVILGVNNRVIMLDDKLNTKKYTFEQYFHDPLIMTEVCCECEYQMRHNIYADHEMGMPKEGWTISVDKQNLYECGWFGAKIVYAKNNVPFTEPFLDEDNKYEFLNKPFPKLFGNFEELSFATYNEMLKLQKEGYEYKGKPIKKVVYGSMGTDGPMTLGCMIRGTENFCADLIEDPVYADELMDYLVEAAAFRIRGLRKHFGLKEVNDGYGFGDDSIALLSCDMYQEMIFPHHKKLFTLLLEDFDTSINSIHLCGDAQRHFKFIKDNLRVYSFDTGYPINFKKLATELGSDILRLNGGVRVDDLMQLSPQQVSKETRRIMEEVMPYTDRFVMREANNLSPCTPTENIYTMYQTVREYGGY